MQFRMLLAAVLGLSLLVVSTGCQMSVSAVADESINESKGAATVKGTLFGTEVVLDSAAYDGQLSLSQGDGWAWNPSLLIFLFLDEGEVPVGKTIEVPAQEASFENPTPHVHCRWNNTHGELETEVATSDYEMTIKFGEVEDGHLPGEIHFAIPGKDTRLTGTFRAVIEK